MGAKKDTGLRNTLIGTLIFGVVFLAVIVVYVGKSKPSDIPTTSTKADGYGITFNAGSTPQIDIWEDFQCPICHSFEAINNSYINELATQGKAKVVFHPMSFIGAESVIAANAAACANDEKKFIEMHRALYEDQSTTENSGHWTTASMISLGASVGITSQSYASCVNNSKYSGWVQKIEDIASSKNVNATPTVFVNGKELDRNTQYMDAAKFKAALVAAGVK